MPTSDANQTARLPYATDEDIFIECSADFSSLIPGSIEVAGGSDGAFSGADLWTLTSASNGFLAQGVAAGMVCQLSGVAPFKKPQFLAVQSIGANSITLRRPGLANGQGLPPSPAGGLTGVTFLIGTLSPMLAATSIKIDEQFSADPNLPLRTRGDIYDLSVIRRAAVLHVLWKQYLALSRSKEGDWSTKRDAYKREYDDEMSRAVVRWGPTGTQQPPSGRGGMRISR